MANSLLRRYNFDRSKLSAFVHSTRLLSSDSLVEFKPGEIGIASGIPEEHLHRRVIIYSPARTATQQGSGKVGKWKINFLSTHKTGEQNCDETHVIQKLSSPCKNGHGRSCHLPGFELAQLDFRWENPLMGWTSTGDPYASVGEAALSFDSAEAAMRFAEKHGWQYEVKKRQTPILKPKSYADNFKWKGPPKAGEN